MILIGDVHAEFKSYHKIIQNEDDVSIQLGDLGIGNQKKVRSFKPGSNDYKTMQLTNVRMPKNHLFLRGNHDNPNECRKHSRYLGDYGILNDGEIFFISGAWSIDRNWRVKNLDWWEEEELSMNDLYKCIELYKKAKPKIVLSHDCPMEIIEIIHQINIIKNRTSQAMQMMVESHRPEKWYFAHHHKSELIHHKGVRYQCLNTLEVVKLDLMVAVAQ